eukprot:175177-Prymnesium_polylepis.1
MEASPYRRCQLAACCTRCLSSSRVAGRRAWRDRGRYSCTLPDAEAASGGSELSPESGQTPSSWRLAT